MKFFLLLTIAVFLVLGLGAFVLYHVSTLIVDKYEMLCKKLISRILKYKRLDSRITQYIIYVVYLLSTIVFVYLTYSFIYKEKSLLLLLLSFIVYPLLVIFLGTVLYEMQIETKERRFIKKVIPRIKNNYIAKRIGLLLGNTFLHMTVHFFVLYLLITIIVSIGAEKVPFQIIYIFFCMLPVSLILFIYIGVKDNNERNFRRMLSYIALLALVLFDSYNKFNGILGVEEYDPAFNYVIYIILALFTAIENCVQAICNDYKVYKRVNKNTRRNT